jgi:hypothetical protein
MWVYPRQGLAIVHGYSFVGPGPWGELRWFSGDCVIGYMRLDDIESRVLGTLWVRFIEKRRLRLRRPRRLGTAILDTEDGPWTQGATPGMSSG